MEELAEAQKKTEKRLDSLTLKVEELAEAQKRTEAEIKKLALEHRKTREQVGGLAHTVGYVLEDRAYRSLPSLLMRDFNVELIEPLKRDYIEIYPGKYQEVNIIGRARRNGREVMIIGDSKSQIKKKDIDNFLKIVKELKDIIHEELILLGITYQASPQVRKYAESKGIKIYFSYEFDL